MALADVRTGLQDALEKEELGGERIIRVWINETAGADAGDADAWEHCLRRVAAADIVVAIYNGCAGWVPPSGGIGICHAELQRVRERHPQRLRVIHLEFPSNSTLRLRSPAEVAQATPENRALAQYLEGFPPFWGRATDRGSLESEVKRAVAACIIDLAVAGAREGRRGGYYLGSSLDWSRLSYPERKAALERTVLDYLRAHPDARHSDDDGAVLAVDGSEVLWVAHGIPSSFGVAEARELVGRPQRNDHRTAVAQPESGLWGPVHVIACHKACTESQIVAFMGQPDLFIVQAPTFGYFVADQVNFVQAFVLTNCRDPSATTLALQRMFDWLREAVEWERLLRRARSRAAILQAIATEIGQGSVTESTRRPKTN